MTSQLTTDVSGSVRSPETYPFRMLVNGELVAGASTIEVVNPATTRVIATSPVANSDLVDEAVGAAAHAFPRWSGLAVEERAECLDRLADAIEGRRDEIARIVTLEQGKPLALAEGDVDAAVAFARYFAQTRLEPEVVRDDDEARIEIHRRPLGVVAAILPWNFPFLQAVYKIAPAVIVGNTVVAKPAPTTPLNTMLLAEIAREVFPAGVVNIIGDDGTIGPLLTSHPAVAKVSFTGSTAVGKAVMRSGADTLKRITLELGGNDGAIVLDDADVDKVVDGIYTWAYSNAGQICIAIKRIFAPASLYDELCEKLAERVRGTIVGDGLDPETQMGPVQNAQQYEAAKKWLDIANKEGEILAGGKVSDRTGYFIEPTLVADLDDDSELVSEETFAPIRAILQYTDIDDAVSRVNSTHYGLGNSVWGSDVERAAQVAGRLDSGTAWVNQHFTVTPDVPFGGRKDSGLGVEFGVDGLRAYTDIQVVNISKV
ncbi:aldehyde dehydrogenase family protein [Rhodococcus sp. NPDC057014]|uniref:aldehyde dehydrogenase family protein n=1 Tax=Rhodococcus sp. NPDC057014 TaxID=3346000 RepID=UPI00363E37C5